MEANKRVFINTIAQYTKALINTILSLYTVRLILAALGQEDYGIFSLIAGVIALLGFVQNALVITTQRYLSYQYGKDNTNELQRIFSNSLVLHIAIALFLSLTMMIFKDFLCSSFLNIAESRREAAEIVYMMSVGMMVVTFITAPFKALYIARENIVFISFIEVLDGVLKFSLALTLLGLDIDKLITYSMMLTGIVIFEFITYLSVAMCKFQECRPTKIKQDFDVDIIKRLAGFAGWTTYGMAAIILRTQGLAILLNKFFGTKMNAAYGIATQAYGAVSFVATSVLNAMNPQIMKAEGGNDRNRMLLLASKESKFVVIMMGILFIPLIFEMDNLLKAWLGNVPAYASFFTQCLLVSYLIDQTTYGLHSANQAIGNIKVYTLIMYTPKLLILPICLLILIGGLGIEYVMGVYLMVELLVAIARLPYLKATAGLDIRFFMKEILLRQLVTIVLIIGISSMFHQLSNSPLGFLYIIPADVLMSLPIAWFTALDSNERLQIKHILKLKK